MVKNQIRSFRDDMKFI